MSDREHLARLLQHAAGAQRTSILLIDDRLASVGDRVQVRRGLMGTATSIAPPPGYARPMATVVQVELREVANWLAQRKS